jgi:hypothetical protein
LADPDVWFHASSKPSGSHYYKYILVYVDDVLVLSHDGTTIMKHLEQYYRLKDGFSQLKQYLGAAVKQWTFPNDPGKTRWALSSEQYIKEAIKNVESYLSTKGRTLRRSNQPMPTSYVPELDITPLLQDDDIHWFQSQISILRWMVEVGRLDIYINVALLLSYLTSPRVGHLEAVFSIYGYLKSRTKSTMVFDDDYVNWNPSDFPTYDWTDFYPDAIDEVPPNAPEPRGRPVQINAFVDASHARSKLTRHSQTGILIYLNKSPIIWYSKTQKMVETSTFGSEFVALRVATEMIKAMQYKLRMMGVPIEGAANVLVDNDTVMKNSTIPSSTLRGKHNSLCYHCVREAVACQILRIAYIPSDENLADMFTKLLTTLPL